MNLIQDTAEVRVRFPLPPQMSFSWGNGVTGEHVALIFIDRKKGESPFSFSQNSHE